MLTIRFKTVRVQDNETLPKFYAKLYDITNQTLALGEKAFKNLTKSRKFDANFNFHKNKGKGKVINENAPKEKKERDKVSQVPRFWSYSS
ncbi:hypothetical protein Gogos_017011 [Gossypium gossypioides]|uniref:Uncharacterized protein n=1 Tax=Gossypium gossypioides TaxID=34282 RepID=A0A7J9BBH7_GOSGO|nr:hypothetical protein [Gossypium gossypioides]